MRTEEIEMRKQFHGLLIAAHSLLAADVYFFPDGKHLYK